VLEVVVENLEGEPVILCPEGGPRNRWISFDLAGTKRGKLALNARVRVSATGFAQTDEVRSGGSYLLQSDLRLHFGLGNHRRVDEAENLLAIRAERAVNEPRGRSLLLRQRGRGPSSLS
jgi:enediyne biosynthesis protein E4